MKKMAKCVQNIQGIPRYQKTQTYITEMYLVTRRLTVIYFCEIPVLYPPFMQGTPKLWVYGVPICNASICESDVYRIRM